MKKIIFVFLLFIISCAPREIARVMGVGTKPFKEQGKVFSRTVNKDSAVCYDLVLKTAREMGASYYRGGKDKNFLVITNFSNSFKQCNSSTEVAVFFNPLESEKTKVEVSSLNHSLSEFVAPVLFDGLEGKEFILVLPQIEAGEEEEGGIFGGL